jgi:hypothetical protein
MPEQRDELKMLSARLLALHAALLEFERDAYEETRGPTKAAELLRLLLNDPHFAWLRPLSGIIAQIDEALDPRRPLDPREATSNRGEARADIDVRSFFRATEELLRSGGTGEFQTNYRDALQKSPEVVMAHANVVKILPPRA